MGIDAAFSDHIYRKTDAFSAPDRVRAEDLMRFYRDDSIDAIYDISGGDLANGVLPYLDYDLIASSGKAFWGYSDLTCVINAIYTKTGKASVLYQVRNLVWADAELQKKRFAAYLSGDEMPLFGFRHRFLQGDHMKGILLGGNIRCFLKLAGTRCWPDLKGKILLLESLGGESGQIASLLNQLDQTGAFEQISGILLGTFTAYEKAGLTLSVFDLLKAHIREDLPVAVTQEVGHGTDARAVYIGRKYEFYGCRDTAVF
jgi:muramoyltetrapeptide carboxypeptidase LdcA involved in peptidoglycan recycling